MGTRLVFHFKRGTQAELFENQGAEENIWTYKRQVTGGWRYVHSEGLLNLKTS
jgi:hypothetical protein